MCECEYCRAKRHGFRIVADPEKPFEPTHQWLNLTPQLSPAISEMVDAERLGVAELVKHARLFWRPEQIVLVRQDVTGSTGIITTRWWIEKKESDVPPSKPKV